MSTVPVGSTWMLSVGDVRLSVVRIVGGDEPPVHHNGGACGYALVLKGYPESVVGTVQRFALAAMEGWTRVGRGAGAG